MFIGGLELGGIFGTNLRLTEFLAHCSPRAQAEGAAPLNAAFADRRLDGKRSRRVESLCRDHAGKGSPCDFISIHSYNRSELMAAKLIRAKEMALEIDPGILSGPLGQLARGVPRLDAAAGRSRGRLVSGQRLLRHVVPRRRASPARSGGQRSAICVSAKRS